MLSRSGASGRGPKKTVTPAGSGSQEFSLGPKFGRLFGVRRPGAALAKAVASYRTPKRRLRINCSIRLTDKGSGRRMFAMSVVLSFVITLSYVTAAAQQSPAARQAPVEVFQVLELPVSLTQAALVKTKTGYQLKCQLSNSSEFEQLGLRYSLAIIDSMNVINGVITRNESFRLAAYETKTVSFKPPLKLTLKGDERLVLMLEQVISSDYLWNVLNTKDSLAAYIAGDYSVAPRVIRVLNQVDAPPTVRIIY